MLASRKRPSPLLLAFTLVVLVLVYHSSNADRIYQHWSRSYEARPAKLPANSTLGFGAVIAVSRDDSRRRHALLQAANVTDFNLTIPHQPDWTEGDIQRFIDGQDKAQRGSILAWLGHHNALKWFLASGLETALILEDDVDWDIRLRSVQVPLAASAFRQLLPPQRSSHPLRNHGSHHTQYWGNHAAWDLLYLGHCGDYFEPINDYGLHLEHDYNLSAMPHILYNDYTLPQPSDLHPYTQVLFDKLGVPPHSRIIHRSKLPLCSFGYAVTRQAALRILNDLAPPKLTKNGPRAFDVALLESCTPRSKKPSHASSHSNPELRDSASSPGLRCWTLNSELFHHMPGQSLIAEIDETMEGEEVGIPPVDLAAQAQIAVRNETTNIDCGFWSGAFAFDDGDMTQLHALQEQVGRKGKCLKERRYQMPQPEIRMVDSEPEERSETEDLSRTMHDARKDPPQRPLE